MRFDSDRRESNWFVTFSRNSPRTMTCLRSRSPSRSDSVLLRQPVGQRKQEKNIGSFADHRGQTLRRPGLVQFSRPPHGCLAGIDRLLNAIGTTHRAPPLDHHENLMTYRWMTTNASTGCEVENSHECCAPEKRCDREPLTIETFFAEPSLAADVQDLHGERLMPNAADVTC